MATEDADPPCDSANLPDDATGRFYLRDDWSRTLDPTESRFTFPSPVGAGAAVAVESTLSHLVFINDASVLGFADPAVPNLIRNEDTAAAHPLSSIGSAANPYLFIADGAAQEVILGHVAALPKRVSDSDSNGDSSLSFTASCNNNACLSAVGGADDNNVRRLTGKSDGSRRELDVGDHALTISESSRRHVVDGIERTETAPLTLHYRAINPLGAAVQPVLTAGELSVPRLDATGNNNLTVGAVIATVSGSGGHGSIDGDGNALGATDYAYIGGNAALTVAADTGIVGFNDDVSGTTGAASYPIVITVDDGSGVPVHKLSMTVNVPELPPFSIGDVLLLPNVVFPPAANTSFLYTVILGNVEVNTVFLSLSNSYAGNIAYTKTGGHAQFAVGANGDISFNRVPLPNAETYSITIAYEFVGDNSFNVPPGNVTLGFNIPAGLRSEIIGDIGAKVTGAGNAHNPYAIAEGAITLNENLVNVVAVGLSGASSFAKVAADSAAELAVSADAADNGAISFTQVVSAETAVQNGVTVITSKPVIVVQSGTDLLTVHFEVRPNARIEFSVNPNHGVLLPKAGGGGYHYLRGVVGFQNNALVVSTNISGADGSSVFGTVRVLDVQGMPVAEECDISVVGDVLEVDEDGRVSPNLDADFPITGLDNNAVGSNPVYEFSAVCREDLIAPASADNPNIPVSNFDLQLEVINELFAEIESAFTAAADGDRLVVERTKGSGSNISSRVTLGAVVATIVGRGLASGYSYGNGYNNDITISMVVEKISITNIAGIGNSFQNNERFNIPSRSNVTTIITSSIIVTDDAAGNPVTVTPAFVIDQSSGEVKINSEDILFTLPGTDYNLTVTMTHSGGAPPLMVTLKMSVQAPPPVPGVESGVPPRFYRSMNSFNKSRRNSHLDAGAFLEAAVTLITLASSDANTPLDDLSILDCRVTAGDQDGCDRLSIAQREANLFAFRGGEEGTQIRYGPGENNNIFPSDVTPFIATVVLRAETHDKNRVFRNASLLTVAVDVFTIIHAPNPVTLTGAVLPETGDRSLGAFEINGAGSGYPVRVLPGSASGISLIPDGADRHDVNYTGEFFNESGRFLNLRLSVVVGDNDSGAFTYGSRAAFGCYRFYGFRAFNGSLLLSKAAETNKNNKIYLHDSGRYIRSVAVAANPNSPGGAVPLFAVDGVERLLRKGDVLSIISSAATGDRLEPSNPKNFIRLESHRLDGFRLATPQEGCAFVNSPQGTTLAVVGTGRGYLKNDWVFSTQVGDSRATFAPAPVIGGTVVDNMQLIGFSNSKTDGQGFVEGTSEGTIGSATNPYRYLRPATVPTTNNSYVFGNVLAFGGTGIHTYDLSLSADSGVAVKTVGTEVIMETRQNIATQPDRRVKITPTYQGGPSSLKPLTLHYRAVVPLSASITTALQSAAGGLHVLPRRTVGGNNNLGAGLVLATVRGSGGDGIVAANASYSYTFIGAGRDSVFGIDNGVITLARDISGVTDATVYTAVVRVGDDSGLPAPKVTLMLSVAADAPAVQFNPSVAEADAQRLAHNIPDSVRVDAGGNEVIVRRAGSAANPYRYVRGFHTAGVFGTVSVPGRDCTFVPSGVPQLWQVAAISGDVSGMDTAPGDYAIEIEGSCSGGQVEPLTLNLRVIDRLSLGELRSALGDSSPFPTTRPDDNNGNLPVGLIVATVAISGGESDTSFRSYRGDNDVLEVDDNGVIRFVAATIINGSSVDLHPPRVIVDTDYAITVVVDDNNGAPPLSITVSVSVPALPDDTGLRAVPSRIYRSLDDFPVHNPAVAEQDVLPLAGFTATVAGVTAAPNLVGCRIAAAQDPRRAICGDGGSPFHQTIQSGGYAFAYQVSDLSLVVGAPALNEPPYSDIPYAVTLFVRQGGNMTGRTQLTVDVLDVDFAPAIILTGATLPVGQQVAIVSVAGVRDDYVVRVASADFSLTPAARGDDGRYRYNLNAIGPIFNNVTLRNDISATLIINQGQGGVGVSALTVAYTVAGCYRTFADGVFPNAADQDDGAPQLSNVLRRDANNSPQYRRAYLHVANAGGGEYVPQNDALVGGLPTFPLFGETTAVAAGDILSIVPIIGGTQGVGGSVDAAAVEDPANFYRVVAGDDNNLRLAVEEAQPLCSGRTELPSTDDRRYVDDDWKWTLLRGDSRSTFGPVPVTEGAMPLTANYSSDLQGDGTRTIPYQVNAAQVNIVDVDLIALTGVGGVGERRFVVGTATDTAGGVGGDEFVVGDDNVIRFRRAPLVAREYPIVFTVTDERGNAYTDTVYLNVGGVLPPSNLTLVHSRVNDPNDRTLNRTGRISRVTDVTVTRFNGALGAVAANRLVVLQGVTLRYVFTGLNAKDDHDTNLVRVIGAGGVPPYSYSMQASVITDLAADLDLFEIKQGMISFKDDLSGILASLSILSVNITVNVRDSANATFSAPVYLAFREELPSFSVPSIIRHSLDDSQDRIYTFTAPGPVMTVSRTAISVSPLFGEEIDIGYIVSCQTAGGGVSRAGRTLTAEDICGDGVYDVAGGSRYAGVFTSGGVASPTAVKDKVRFRYAPTDDALEGALTATLVVELLDLAREDNSNDNFPVFENEQLGIVEASREVTITVEIIDSGYTPAPPLTLVGAEIPSEVPLGTFHLSGDDAADVYTLPADIVRNPDNGELRYTGRVIQDLGRNLETAIATIGVTRGDLDFAVTVSLRACYRIFEQASIRRTNGEDPTAGLNAIREDNGLAMFLHRDGAFLPDSGFAEFGLPVFVRPDGGNQHTSAGDVLSIVPSGDTSGVHLRENFYRIYQAPSPNNAHRLAVEDANPQCLLAGEQLPRNRFYVNTSGRRSTNQTQTPLTFPSPVLLPGSEITPAVTGGQGSSGAPYIVNATNVKVGETILRLTADGLPATPIYARGGGSSQLAVDAAGNIAFVEAPNTETETTYNIEISFLSGSLDGVITIFVTAELRELPFVQFTDEVGNNRLAPAAGTDAANPAGTAANPYHYFQDVSSSATDNLGALSVLTVQADGTTTEVSGCTFTVPAPFALANSTDVTALRSEFSSADAVGDASVTLSATCTDTATTDLAATDLALHYRVIATLDLELRGSAPAA